jgi:hypothetical protein
MVGKKARGKEGPYRIRLIESHAKSLRLKNHLQKGFAAYVKPPPLLGFCLGWV